MTVVADENLAGPGRSGPATQLLTGDPAAADADLDSGGPSRDSPGSGWGYWHGT